MKSKRALILTATLFISSTIFVIPSQASECNASDPCGVWAMLDSQGTVTNIIVCQPSVCGGGMWAGQKVVPQVAANPVTNDTHGVGGYWGTYDDESKEFTVDRSGPNESPNRSITSRENSSTSDENGNLLSETEIEVTRQSNSTVFKYEDTIKSRDDFDDKGEPINGWNQSYLRVKPLSDDSPANVRVTKKLFEAEITRVKQENLDLLRRLTEDELIEEVTSQDKLLILENISSITRLLNTWIKNLKTQVK
jgi:hypothetical protein